MKFTFNGRQYRITFTHPQEQNDIPGIGLRTQRSSIAKIYEVVGAVRDPEQNPVAFGSVTCNHNDQFNHAVGRKLALQKALSGFSKEFRTAAWNAYQNRNNASVSASGV